MKKAVAWLVPGQGEDLRAYADLPEIAQPERTPGGQESASLLSRLFELLGESLRFDLARGLREGHPRLLDTEVAQPVAVALSLALGAARGARGEAPVALAGLSLGELAAVACGGALAPEDAVRAAIVRGQLMAEAARAVPGAMLALQAADESEVERAVATGRAAGSMVIAGRTSPTQWILSGDHSALRAVLAMRPGTLLRVQGAWHSAAMAGVVGPWETFLRRLPWRPLVHPVALAGHVAFAATSEDLVTSLVAQLIGPTRWFATLQLLRTHGVTDVEVLGPPRILRALWRESVASADLATTATATVVPTMTVPTTSAPASGSVSEPRSPETAPERDAAWLAARALEPVAMGGDELSTLLPQRPPLLLVDQVWARGVPGRSQPALLAALLIEGNESVLRGHFPGRSVWPGVYTIEGLAQTCILAGALARDRRDPNRARAGTDNAGTDNASVDNAGADNAGAQVFGVIAAVKVKLLRLVEPPACLVYFVEKAAVVGDLHRFDVRAAVGGRDVAAGTLDVAFPREAVSP